MSIQNINASERVSYNRLYNGDTLILRTLNSTYQFTLTDISAKRGILRGGAIRGTAVTAILLNHFELFTGAHIQFQILSAGDCIYMKTSEIKSLQLIESAENVSLDFYPTIRMPNPAAGFLY